MNNDEVLSTLLQKAKGYKEDEITREYAVDDNGDRRIVKEKVVTKYYAPDTAALKTYLDITGGSDDLSTMDEKALMKEANRLIKKIKERRKDETPQ